MHGVGAQEAAFLGAGFVADGEAIEGGVFCGVHEAVRSLLRWLRQVVCVHGPCYERWAPGGTDCYCMRCDKLVLRKRWL